MDSIITFIEGLDFSPLIISLKTGIVATIICFFLGIYAAAKTTTMSFRVRAILDVILNLPMVIPPTAVGFFLLLIFRVDGDFGSFLADGLNIKVVQTWLGCIIAASVIAFPLMYRAALAAFEQIDPNIISAARTLGISENKIFWKIQLPNAAPGIYSGIILTFSRALGEYGATAMLAGNIAGKTGTVSQKIAVAAKEGDFSTSGFWTVVVMAIVLIMIIAANYIFPAKAKDVRKSR